MLDACPVHPKGTMVIPMLWRISGYVVCMMGVKNKNHHTHPYHALTIIIYFKSKQKRKL